MKTTVLAHYYTEPEIKALADRVGDSLDLAKFGKESDADRIVFAGVRFMAETAKILSPEKEVVLPDWESTCSLVEQTDIEGLKEWDWAARYSDPNTVHVAYINSSAEHKAIADMIVTSRIVVDVIQKLHDQGRRVIFSPDRNMGEYLNWRFGFDMPVWSAVCDVHDKFAEDKLEHEWKKWTDGPKYLLAHPESPLPVLKRADLVASTHGMLQWIKDFEGSVGTIYVATEEGLLFDMYQLRPELDLRLAPTYEGCVCNQCPFMKKNTELAVRNAIAGHSGNRMDHLTEESMNAARQSIEAMFHYQETGEFTF